LPNVNLDENDLNSLQLFGIQMSTTGQFGLDDAQLSSLVLSTGS